MISTKTKFLTLSLCLGAFMLSACASTPMGPTVLVMPPKGKSFDQFSWEQETCKRFAEDQVRGAAERANTTGILAGVGTTALGAGLGAAVGGGGGAAIGAASGAVVGTGAGAVASGSQQNNIQLMYNNAFMQCMKTKGNLPAN
ncbi:MAG: glycine zipper family protein [Alphaproteobacteria bacterium]|nr:glycine zipper family protein [Alphaproteobacteria bacterium]MCL2505590.1 glycine zipper family protein [Alphaproteobacteria bacterium]